MPTYDSPEPISAVIEIGSGAARINASDRTDTVVSVLPRDKFDAGDIKVAEQTRIENSGGRLLVKAPKTRAPLRSFGWGPSIVVTVDLPTGSRIDVDAAAADVRCEGRFGEAKVETSYGEIWLDQADGLRLHTAWGRITVARSAGHIDVTTAGGEVRIGEIEGTAVVKNAHGGITIGEVTGHLRLSTSSGEINVGRALASVVAKSAYGAIRIDAVVGGSIDVETSYGQLEVGVAEGTAVWLDVSTQHGSVESFLKASEGPAPTDETASVRARTSYGRIVIRRS